MNSAAYTQKRYAVERIRKVALPAISFVTILAIFLSTGAPAFAQSTFFASGNLIVVVEGCGVYEGTCTAVPNGAGTGSGNSSVGGYGDNQGAPLTLFQYTPNATSSVTYVNSLVLPQTASGANFPVSGEYGSSSEGTLQLSGAGQYLTLMGYGIGAATFDASPDSYGAAPSGALAQSGSLTGQSYTPVPRVLALIDANGNVNSSTAIYNIFDTNNPRSAYTLNGTAAYVSGQGSGSDATGGVFLTPIGAPNNAPTAITGLDTTGNTIAQDTREVQIYNNTLYISVDSKEGSGSNRDFIGTLGTPPVTGLYQSGAGPTQLSGFATSGAGKLTISANPGSNGNNLNAGDKINLSPVSYFFASPSVLYVADSGNPKNDSNGDNNSTGTANIGNGGLQKWVNSSGSWNLKYTLYQGLNIVNNGNTSGTTGLYGLTGTVSGGTVYLYATNYTLNDLDHTYLYGITDTLSNTTPPGTSLAFTLLDTAPSDSNFKGLAFAPGIPAGDVEITSSPSGLAFTSAGSGCAGGTYTTPQTLSWTPGSNCALSVVTPQNGPGVQYDFTQWEDGTKSTTHTVTAPETTAIYTANFASLTVPAITWPAPAAITFGSALSGVQLDATAGVPGTFTYSPAAGTVLPVGSNETLSVIFTPSDTVHYTTANASTAITVNPASSPSSPANLVVTKVLTRSGGNVNVQLTIANTGGTDAANVVLTSVKVGSDTAVPLPQSLGTIAAGASVQTTVSVPASVGASGAGSSLTLSGTYTGGTFSSSARITLP
jgi:hypothetical protein